MNGRIAGLSTLITSQISSKAVYVHCYAHRLNLALEAACSKISKVKEMVCTAKSLYAYVEGSAKRSHLFKNIQDESIRTPLKRLCETRWNHRVLSFKAIKKSYASLLTFLSIQDEETTSNCGVSASVLLNKIQNLDFVFLLDLMLSCFTVINLLNESFQMVEVDIFRAQEFYIMSRQLLKKIKRQMDIFNLIFPNLFKK